MNNTVINKSSNAEDTDNKEIEAIRKYERFIDWI